MEIEDVTSFGQQLVKLGLLTEMELREAIDDARDEAGRALPDVIHLKSVLERKGLLTNYQTAKVLKGDVASFYYGGYRVLYKISSG